MKKHVNLLWIVGSNYSIIISFTQKMSNSSQNSFNTPQVVTVGDVIVGVGLNGGSVFNETESKNTSSSDTRNTPQLNFRNPPLVVIKGDNKTGIRLNGGSLFDRDGFTTEFKNACNEAKRRQE